MQTQAVLTSLQEQRVEDVHIELLKEILHQQLDDSPPTHRMQQEQHQERCTTGRYHIAQAVHGSTGKHI